LRISFDKMGRSYLRFALHDRRGCVWRPGNDSLSADSEVPALRSQVAENRNTARHISRDIRAEILRAGRGI
jgi:hypothetical protein